jgi:hypothetical protein
MAHGIRTVFGAKALRRGLCAFGLAGSLALVVAPEAFAQAFRGSQEDQQACTDDVFRLCGEFVPDETRIIACMKAHKANLSPACKAVFSRDDPPPPPPPHKKRRHT